MIWTADHVDHVHKRGPFTMFWTALSRNTAFQKSQSEHANHLRVEVGVGGESVDLFKQDVVQLVTVVTQEGLHEGRVPQLLLGLIPRDRFSQDRHDACQRQLHDCGRLQVCLTTPFMVSDRNELYLQRSTLSA